MEPTPFDTTVWIDFIHGNDTRQTQLFEKIISQYPDFVPVTPTILQEMLQGVRSGADFDRVKTILDSFQMLAPNWPTVAVEAARLDGTLRKKRSHYPQKYRLPHCPDRASFRCVTGAR